VDASLWTVIVVGLPVIAEASNNPAVASRNLTMFGFIVLMILIPSRSAEALNPTPVPNLDWVKSRIVCANSGQKSANNVNSLMYSHLLLDALVSKNWK
jgi:hypothetical protein